MDLYTVMRSRAKSSETLIVLYASMTTSTSHMKISHYRPFAIGRAVDYKAPGEVGNVHQGCKCLDPNLSHHFLD